jgi:hypothetical protein
MWRKPTTEVPIDAVALSPIANPLLRPFQVVFDEPWYLQPFFFSIIGVIQFLIFAGITLYTFRWNARQKLLERRADVYAKVVIDPSLPELTGFFVEAGC